MPALHWHCKWQGHGKGSCYICTWWRCLFISRSQTGMLEEEQLANRTSECLVLSCLSVCLSSQGILSSMLMKIQRMERLQSWTVHFQEMPVLGSSKMPLTRPRQERDQKFCYLRPWQKSVTCLFLSFLLFSKLKIQILTSEF